MMPTRPRLLVLTNKIPYPPDSGDKIRLLNFLKHLSADWQIDLVTYARNTTEAGYARDLGSVCESVRPVVFAPASPGRWAKYLRLLLDPYPAYGFFSSQMEQAVHQAIAQRPHSAILVSSLPMAQFIASESDRRKTLYDQVDAHYLNAFDTARAVRLSAKPYFFIQALKLKQHERRLAAGYFAKCVVVSELDAQALRVLSPAARVEVVPNGVDTHFFQPMSGEEPNRLVFTGTMNYWPNIDAVRYFCEEVMPRIWAALPQVHLDIVGHSPLPDTLSLGSERITVTGRVDDIRPYIAAAAIYIAPFRYGSGTHLKVLEAMAMGKAVVATSRGAQGLGVHPGQDIAIGDGAAALADEIVRLLHDPPARQRLGNAAREFVVTTHDWKHSAQRLNELLASVAS